MLIGLAGMAVPILVHLLSRKNYDVVDWGAMQFLELGQRTRRRIQLEEILLMLLRMGLVGLLALALARPWVSGSLLGGLVKRQNRDIVLVIDSSYSMGRLGSGTTPHDAAIQWAHEFLEELQPGDTVALLDARDVVRAAIDPPIRDFRLVREQLDALPGPTGTANLSEAAMRGLQLLNRTSNLSREVIVVTDGQAQGWSADDRTLWAHFDDLRSLPAVRPRVWVVNINDGDDHLGTNFSVEKLNLSREMTVAGFPIKISSNLRSFGNQATTARRVYFEVDGQRLADKSQQIQLPPDGQMTVEFEHRFSGAGTHVVSVVLEDDELPGDDRSEAVVEIADALPVLLIDGDPQLDLTRSETYFARVALTAMANQNPWIQTSVIPWNEPFADRLSEFQVVVLANVPQLTQPQADALKRYVKRGGGLWIVLGENIDAANYSERLIVDEAALLPAVIESIEEDSIKEFQGVHIIDSSLELPWLSRFRSTNGGRLAEARFSRWWRVLPFATKSGQRAQSTQEPGSSVSSTTSESSPAAKRANSRVAIGDAQSATEDGIPIVAARLDTSDPLFVQKRYGRGQVLMMTSTLDADWNTLPARRDFVPLLHEIMFLLASGKTVRNVDVGTPLVVSVDDAFDAAEYAFFAPQNQRFPVVSQIDEHQRLAILNNTQISGIYALRRIGSDASDAESSQGQRFVVNADRAESDVTPLDEAEVAELESGDRLTFLRPEDDLSQKILVDDSQSEFWYLILLLFLMFLIGEVWMTRRLVRGGHVVVPDEDDRLSSEAGPLRAPVAGKRRSRRQRTRKQEVADQ